MTILTSSGNYFHFDNPELHPFSIEDIANSLSKICRFTGHVSHFYSVAQHSVYVSRLLPIELRLQGLLHDAAEAYVGDVSSPLKRRLPNYKEIEHRVERALNAQFGLPFPLDPLIKEADLRMLSAERKEFLPVADDSFWPGWDPLRKENTLEPIPFRIGPMDWQKAKSFFLAEFYAITTGTPRQLGSAVPRGY
jgi:hypothetical protein